MKLRAVAVFFLPLVLACSVQASSDAAGTPASSLMDRTLQILHLKHSPKPANRPQMHHQFELKLDISPMPLTLGNTREMKVTVSLFNRSKKAAHLDFPTSQRIDVLVRDASGKAVNTWSEDQSFTNDPATVTVNPDERLEYTASVPTRDMSAGKPYVIEVSFPNYAELKIQQPVTPVK
jgi:hypothetical protein